MIQISRRDVARILGAVPFAAASGPVLAARPSERRFPRDFQWGCATAAYQIEGATREDGRGESIWDVFAHTPGRIKDGSNADIACDSYHRFRDDRKCLQAIGAKAYRLSFAWPRIVPDGRGAVNIKGLDHYKQVIDDLLEHGITPYVTLFHWDLPSALPGAWLSRDTASAFADFAALVAREFGDRVHNFMTVNEIRSFIDIGYGQGRQAPGLKLGPKELNQARHHALLAHGLGAQAIRAAGRHDTKVGQAENAFYPVPAVETEAGIAAARKAFRHMNARVLLPMLEGDYSPEYQAAEGANAAVVAPGDMTAIGSPLDFIGLNIYTGDFVVPDDGPQGFRPAQDNATYPNMGLPFLRIVPEAAYWGPRILSELFGPKAIFITENGSVAGDRLVDDHVYDAPRIMYLRNYLGHMQRATAEGIPVKGYFAWSLLDNFEWGDGFGPRFGLFYTDYSTQRRIPKFSAEWFRTLTARNALV